MFIHHATTYYFQRCLADQMSKLTFASAKLIRAALVLFTISMRRLALRAAIASKVATTVRIFLEPLQHNVGH